MISAMVRRLLLVAGDDGEARRPCTAQAVCWYGCSVGEATGPPHTLEGLERYIAQHAAKEKLIIFMKTVTWLIKGRQPA
jgi:hypothetical protein